MKRIFFMFFLSLGVGLSMPALSCSMRPMNGQTDHDFKKSISDTYQKMEKACLRTGGVWHDQKAYYKARPATTMPSSDFDSCSDRYAKASKGFFVVGCFEQRCKCAQSQCVDNQHQCVSYAKWKNDNTRKQKQ